jgi:4-hydroxybenzoate polyprenyltransferase
VGVGRRLAGLARLTHPFPSLLNGAVTTAFALLAGATPATAGRLGIAMVSLQAAIGALNDLVDAPRDAGLKPGKPIPAGLVSPVTARLVVVGGAALGIGLSLPSGPATMAVALLILIVGGLYDLRFKGTPWSWLPFALGIPLLPVYAWMGATGRLPAAFAILVPAAALAGAGLAIANALADVERDRAAGTRSVATRLGPRLAWTVHAALHAAVVGLAVGGLAGFGGTWQGLTPVAAGAAVVAAGVALSASGRPSLRERGWELEAVGIGILGASWLAAVVLDHA